MSTGTRTASILVACGKTMACELISQALEQKAGFRVGAMANSEKDALEEIRTKGVNFALVTAALSDGPLSGLLLLQKIQQSFPTVKTVLLFDRSEEHLIEAAFRAGARGALSLSDSDFETLCKCVEKVHAGQVWANSEQLLQVLSTLSQHTAFRVLNADGAHLLTKREEDVVRLVEEGLTNRQIANELHLSEHTVRNNLFRIFDKLGVSTRVERALNAVNSAKQVLATVTLTRPEEADAEAEEFAPTAPSRVQ
jgi:DNA-binding NarL/FixJ family response regulator